MTDFRITEADVGKKFRLRNGDVVEVINALDAVTFHVKFPDGTIHGYSCSGEFFAGDPVAHPLDIVERLPEEGGGYKDGDCRPDGYRHPSISQMAMKPKDEWERPTPTMTASDGKQYPMELFGVQQRFSDRTPPEGVDLVIYISRDNFAPSSFRYQLQHDDIWYWDWDGEWERSGENWRESRWTLAPTPAVEKVEPQIWDPFTCQNERGRGDYFIMSDGNSGGLELYIDETELPKISKQIDALHAWKNHILAKGKPQ